VAVDVYFCSVLFFVEHYEDHGFLRSFPTRRSSDLLFPGRYRGSASSRARLSYLPRHLVPDQELRQRPRRCSLPTRHPHQGSFGRDRKSTRLNSSHVATSYAVFCLKKKTAPNKFCRF